MATDTRPGLFAGTSINHRQILTVSSLCVCVRARGRACVWVGWSKVSQPFPSFPPTKKKLEKSHAHTRGDDKAF